MIKLYCKIQILNKIYRYYNVKNYKTSYNKIRHNMHKICSIILFIKSGDEDMNYIENEKIFSWEICKNDFVTKLVDKSFYTYGETIIPIEIRSYFGIADYTKGDEVNICVLFSGKEYESHIKFENNFNRSKLILCKELRDSIKQAIDMSCCSGKYDKYHIKAAFTKENTNRYRLNLSVDI